MRGSLNPSPIPASPFTGLSHGVIAQSNDPLSNPLAGGWTSATALERASDFSGPTAAAEPMAFACPGMMRSLMDSDATLCRLADTMGQQRGRDPGSSPGEGSTGPLSDDGGSDTFSHFPNEATGVFIWSQLPEEASGRLTLRSSSIHADWNAMVESLPSSSLMMQASEESKGWELTMWEWFLDGGSEDNV